MQTIISIPDYYNANVTVNLRVTPLPLNEIQREDYRATHYAILTAGQLAKIKRALSNGPRGVNVTKQDRMTGKDIEAEFYFDL